ncbi:double-cubane-cluster-containing anaerobic reductase [Desulfuribacillus alkaliarsenatis]|uniref:double-cubane-cluster-containing anaerobic reductase n=1 Tax=Desulfuribacillus alkaliarsenatis TaxID=766136 RepID=UPI000B314975|nr:double-cubane-cluster-containing anaerobic reductase [Desulfuribacillus alkaliarsenatis]
MSKQDKAYYEQLWADLGVDVPLHDQLIRGLAVLERRLHRKQKNRPEKMDYFNKVLNDLHGHRIAEMVEHKKQGGKVVGSYCVFIPEDMVLAADGIHVGLCAGSSFPVQEAEKVLPRNTCPLIKSSFGYKYIKACPYTEASDLIVGETTCDGKTKMFEILEDYHPTYVIEVPQRKNSRNQDVFTAELLDFKLQLENLTGNKITAENLKNATSKVENKFKALQRLFKLRQADPAPISGLDVLTITQIGFQDDVKRFTQQVNALCDELEERVRDGVGVAPKGAPRILISGSPMSLPNWRLHSMLEKAGAVVVCEESCVGTRLFSYTSEPQSDSLEDQIAAIGQRHMSINCACFTPNQGRIDDVLRMAEEYQVDGVIHYTLQFCHTFNNEGTKMEQALDTAGIPLLRVEADYSDDDSGQLKTRVEAFLELLEDKKTNVE